jgi:hypothetical protein
VEDEEEEEEEEEDEEDENEDIKGELKGGDEVTEGLGKEEEV